jgi:NADPH:quinone reductase-like Zn-dependent oxidoreductase
VLTGYGRPEMLRWQEVAPLHPAAGQIRLRVRAAGVGPTDLAIRRGNLKEAFALAPHAVLGFEAAGVVDARGEGVDGGLAVGDEVAAWLPGLGGYGEYALASAWTLKPPGGASSKPQHCRPRWRRPSGCSTSSASPGTRRC